MRIPTIDMISFLIGAAVATVVWWLIFLARPLLRQIIGGVQDSLRERQLQASAGIEGTYRKIIFKQTQGMHLAASLFSLDEIVQPTRLLAPPPVSEPGAPAQRLDTVEQSLPYLPTWPEIASVYQARTLTIEQALSGGMNLILVGQPGTGKTVALAHLASQIVNRRPGAEGLHQNVPFLLHVADLGLPLANNQPADLIAPISNFLSEHSSVFDARRMPEFVEYAFQSERAMLLLDGVDELPQSAIQDVVIYLRNLLKAYPKTRVITTAGPEFANGIPGLGFSALTIMPWTAAQQQHFIEKWSDLWQRHVAGEIWARVVQPIDALLLNRWLSTDNFGLTPLELTLKIWSVYGGDIRGARPAHAIDAHLHRLLPQNTPFEVLSTLGAQASLHGTTIFESKNAREWTKSFEPAVTEVAPAAALVSEVTDPEGEPAPEGEAPASAANGKKSPKKAAPQVAVARTGLLGQLTTSGILASHTGNHLRFTHPIFMGFLAGQSINSASGFETLASQPSWSGQTTTMRYIAAFHDATPLVNSLLAADDPVLKRPSFGAARLLREAPRNAPWRPQVMARLVEILQDDHAPIGLRGQVMAAFAMSGDPSIASLFRQLMQAPSSDLRRLGALGAGALADAKAVETLASIIGQSTGPSQQAACLALVQIASPAALEAVAVALLRGDEQLRITAAEALANHSAEGHDALREGITNQDILLRRAAIYGLSRIDEPWSIELIERAQVADEQWAVRSAAIEVVEGRQKPDPHIQHRLKPPAETPWLIEYAGKHGQGITPGVPATNVFLLAFKEENADLRSAALNYLKYIPTDGVLAELYKGYYSDDPEFQEEIYQALTAIAYNGTPLPHPKQFGLG